MFQEEEIDYIETIDFIEETSNEYSLSDSTGVVVHSRNWFDQNFTNEYIMSYAFSDKMHNPPQYVESNSSHQ